MCVESLFSLGVLKVLPGPLSVVSSLKKKISRLSWRLGRDSAAERLPRRPSTPDPQTKTSQNLKPPNIPISSPKVQNSWEALKLTQVSASFQSPKMK